MFVKYLFLLLPLFFTGSCTKPSQETLFGQERDKRVYSALRKFKLAMEAKGFYAAGIGEGLDHSTGKQNYIGLTFAIEKLPNIDFARKIEVETLQEFLCCINSEEGIQDYVAEYPYPLKFIYVAFISQHPEEGLFSVSNFQEKLLYDQDDSKKPIGPLIEMHRESYADALLILSQQ
jgi:hypothetical protein